MASAPAVSVLIAEGVVTVRWDRPPVHVFDRALLQELSAALRSPEVLSAHVVRLEGARHRWSAGLDVRDHRAGSLKEMLRTFRSLLEALWEVPGPTVAQVEGPCLGGGLELLSACDLAYAGASATFGQPEVRLGVLPPFAIAEASTAIGPRAAAELLLLGETLPADRAAALGLVNRVFPDDQLSSEVDRLVGALRRNRRETLRLLKRTLHEVVAFPKAALDRAESVYQQELMALPRAEEGLDAFVEKRPPRWPEAAR